MECNTIKFLILAFKELRYEKLKKISELLNLNFTSDIKVIPMTRFIILSNCTMLEPGM